MYYAAMVLSARNLNKTLSKILLISALFTVSAAASTGLFAETASVSAAASETPASLSAADYLDFTFCGDLMAHNVNFNSKDYSSIYKDIECITQNDDLTFTNLETPVTESLPYSSYPEFNVHAEYVNAAINAGFDVFSTAHNHTNDQGKKGIAATYRFFEDAPVYASGLKAEGLKSLNYEIINVKGWKILFTAVTELLNRYSDMERINYIEPTDRGYGKFISEIQEIKSKNKCDLVILSIHTCEEEYVTRISSERKKKFKRLLDSGADIIWANHPHVPRSWEIYRDKETGRNTKLVMYGLGNLISGQRIKYNTENPEDNLENKGDGIIMQVSAVKDENGVYFDYIEPYFITTHIDDDWNFIIKRYTQSFINFPGKTGRTKLLSEYYKKRYSYLIKNFSGNIICP